MLSEINDYELFLQNKPAIVTKWFLKSFSSNIFTPFILVDEPSAESQLYDKFKELSLDAKENFKEALSNAIYEWRPNVYIDSVLQRLAVLATYIGCVEGIRAIASKIETDEFETLKDRYDDNGDDRYFIMMEIILAVLRRFSRDKQIHHLFYRIYFNKETDYRFASQIFLGLCEYEPEEYIQYVPRLLYFVRNFPRHTLMEYTFDQLSKIVSLQIIMDEMVVLNEDDQKLFNIYMYKNENSPVIMKLVYGNGLSYLYRFSEHPFPIPVVHGKYSKYRELENTSINDDLSLEDQFKLLLSPLENRKN
jgi:hypothetical protein